MRTLRLQVGQKPHAGAAIGQAAAILRRGGLVAFPTETVYGLGANALDRAAVLRLFSAKERPAWDPLIVHVASLQMLQDVVAELPPRAQLLVERCMPGPLTLVLPRAPAIPAEVAAGRATVAVRMPAHPVALALIEAAGVPLAAPSANRFGRPSPTTAEHVLADLDGRIDAVLDAGPTTVGVESTVLDPTAQPPRILRPGGLSREALEEVLGPVEVAESAAAAADDEPRQGLASPGTALRHYAPRARVVTVEGGAEELVRAATGQAAQGRRVGAMLPAGWAAPADVTVFAWGEWHDPAALARNLYAGLRALDEQQVDLILCPLPAPAGLGLALRDRLRRAAR
jgi:L-threonylcarbamoyladenylate synthase